MLKRAANHLKGLATPFLSDITGAVNSLTGGLNNTISGDQAKVAATLLKKSPFEIGESPQEKLSKNPLSFSQVQYPLDLTTNELGHYIIFYTLKNRFGGAGDLDVAHKLGFATYDTNDDFASKSMKDLRAQTGNFKAVKVDNSVLSKMPTHTQVTSAIALYMPPNTKVSYGASYDAEATELSGDIARTIGNVKSASDLSSQINEALKGAAAGMGQYGKNVIGEAVSMAGAGDPVKLASKAFGVAVNPNEEQFYGGPSFREFSYSFEFWPRSKKELEAVQNIIFLFKYHMHPELETGVTGGRLFKVPSEFEIHYAYRGQENEYMNRISKCALKSCDVDYGPDGQFSTFEGDEKGASPVTYKMSLTFVELELMTKDKITQGY